MKNVSEFVTLAYLSTAWATLLSFPVVGNIVFGLLTKQVCYTGTY